jgi:hypothetical protein
MGLNSDVLYLLPTQLADIDHTALAAMLISTRYTKGRQGSLIPCNVLSQRTPALAKSLSRILQAS